MHFLNRDATALKLRCPRRALSWLLLLALLALPAVSARAFIFDTYGRRFLDGDQSGQWKYLDREQHGREPGGGWHDRAFQQQFELLYNEEDGTFRLRNHDSWLCLGALNGGTAVGTPVVTVASYTRGDFAEMEFCGCGQREFSNRECGERPRVADGQRLARARHAGHVVRQHVSILAFRLSDPLPKKGLAGWDDQWSRFNISLGLQLGHGLWL